MFSQYLFSALTFYFSFSQSLTRLVAAQAPLPRIPGTPITDQEFNATYTHLVGFEGCGIYLQRDIVQAFWDAASILNTDGIRTGINWNSPAAIEYLGSPFSSPYRNTIQSYLYTHAATFEPPWANFPLDFTINARCDDPDDECLCVPSDIKAYTANTGGSNNNGPFINFCPKFFTQPRLGTVLARIPHLLPVDKYNVLAYKNQDVHARDVPYQSSSNSPPNLQVADLYISVRDGWRQVYGPELSKDLARTTRDTGRYVLQNAENLMYFAMVTHYQSRLNGEYPSRPFSMDIPDGPPQRSRPYSIFDFTNNTIKVSNVSADNPYAQLILPASATCQAGPAITFEATTAPFAANEDYPADYQSSLSSWMSTWDAYWATAAPSSGSPSSSTPQTTSSQPPASTTAATIDSCGDKYEFLFDHFQIQGKYFNAAKFGADGSGLKKQIQGCGALTGWSFEQLTNSSFQWSASGNLPIGTKACVGRAVVSAGGSSPDGCTGAG